MFFDAIFRCTSGLGYGRDFSFSKRSCSSVGMFGCTSDLWVHFRSSWRLESSL
jgi:hypothetical protein